MPYFTDDKHQQETKMCMCGVYKPAFTVEWNSKAVAVALKLKLLFSYHIQSDQEFESWNANTFGD